MIFFLIKGRGPGMGGFLSLFFSIHFSIIIIGRFVISFIHCVGSLFCLFICFPPFPFPTKRDFLKASYLTLPGRKSVKWVSDRYVIFGQ